MLGLKYMLGLHGRVVIKPLQILFEVLLALGITGRYIAVKNKGSKPLCNKP